MDLLVETLRGLRANAFRFGLTASGVFWGTLMLTYLAASSDGYDRHFARELEKIGQRIVFLFPGVATKTHVGQRGSRRLEVKREDVDRLALLPLVERVAPNTFLGPRLFRANRRTKLVWTNGASEHTAPTRNFVVAAGRAITRSDVEDNARVVFLGARAATRLFGRGPAVGRTVHVDGVPFTVIGVSEPKGAQLLFMGALDDEVALVPVSTAQQWFSQHRILDQVVFAPRTREASWDALRRVRELLALRHHVKPDDRSALGAFNIQEPVRIVEALLLALRLFLTTASLVTLGVGAVGVTNVMLVMVGERTREFGLRKAIGAPNRALFAQVLAETIAITLVAGGVGGVFGALLVRFSQAMIERGTVMQAVPELNVGTVVMIVVLLAAIGLVAGFVPARRAARIDPAVALRTT
jgi:putative ABC transport system permease protein